MLRDPPRRGGVSTRDKKRELREAALLKRRSIDPPRLELLSSRVMSNLLSLPEYERAKVIISYCAKADEVQTRQIIEKALENGKHVAAIVTDLASKTLTFSEIRSFQDDLEPGPFGILQPKKTRLFPVSLNDADMILVPLVAWDDEGHRLGYGGGYFDRALERARGVVTVGLALESQRLDRIPPSRHDVPLDVIVTEKRIVRRKG
ncbi:MAG TPA: 5-formyltetrahydrofolate cyclo-ligase [Nitrososphaerales archaeon]|nr:5-formyltetrahydrofolate cyclo-ligase [Nitrososphaerales archaeon]